VSARALAGAVLRRLGVRRSAPPAVAGASGIVLSEGGAVLARRFAHLRPREGARFFDALCNHLGSLHADPCVGMYFEFAISSNERGRQCARLLGRHAPLSGARYLDVGCAYAGFLVAFAEQGAQVAGVDLDPQLLALAAHNLRDHGLAVMPQRRDLTAPADMAAFAASQDLVTCNDVIEHVDDPAAAIRNLAAILRPGGLLYLEIPNRRFPPFVARDGHFQLFGITLLEHDEAEGYYHHMHPGRPYTVGHYLDLEEYERLFAEAGLSLTVLPETFEGVTEPAIRAGLAALRAGVVEDLATVPAPLRPRVEALVGAFLAEAESGPGGAAADGQRYAARYGPAFWRILGRRTA